MFELHDNENLIVKIKVIGVGGGGGNTIDHIVDSKISGIECISINTDKQHLETSKALIKLQIGMDLTKGLGVGGNPELGRQAAIDDRDAIVSAIEGADMIFITAGMGGGTGTGATPIIASYAKELGILTTAVVTKPFNYEGRQRMLKAQDGIKELKNQVDTLLVISNNKIHLISNKKMSLLESFATVNNVLRQSVQGISDLILQQGLINLDFADIKNVISNGGRAIMGIGVSKEDNAGLDAAKKAVSNPLLEDYSVDGAKGIIINVSGGERMPYSVMEEASAFIHSLAHKDANIFLGAIIDPKMGDEVRVTIIATGIEEQIEHVKLNDIPIWQPNKIMVKPKVPTKLSSKGTHEDLFKEIKEIDETKNIITKDKNNPYFLPALSDTNNIITPISLNSKKDISQKNDSSDKQKLKMKDMYNIPSFLRKRI